MNMLNNKSGFTLMELTVVVIVIGILAAAGVPYYKNYVERQKAASGITTLRMIADSVERYMVMRGDQIPYNFKLSSLDADIDRSRLSNDGLTYDDGNFIYVVESNTGTPVAFARRKTGEYIFSFGLNDTNTQYGLACTPLNYCCDELNMFCTNEGN